MITGTELEANTSQPLLDTELPVIDTMPTELPDASPGEIDGEGPLALDYRVWDKQIVEGDRVESPRMDVTYGIAAEYLHYDGSHPHSYRYYFHVVTDK
jgi:hypothetical protein